VFQGSKGMEKDELNKVFKNLNIFPNLLTNLDIKKLIDKIQAENGSIFKSPRNRLEEDATTDKEVLISYDDFETMLIDVAIKGFNPNKHEIDEPLNYTSYKTNISGMLVELIHHIKEPAKIIYQVNLAFEPKMSSRLLFDNKKQSPEKDDKPRLSMSNMKLDINRTLNVEMKNKIYHDTSADGIINNTDVSFDKIIRHEISTDDKINIINGEINYKFESNSNAGIDSYNLLELSKQAEHNLQCRRNEKMFKIKKEEFMGKRN